MNASRLGMLAAIGLIVFTIGCGKSNGLVPVSGTITYSDGTPVHAQIANVTFQPAGEGKGATGTLAEDGTYKLTTLEPDDGVAPGKYKVTIVATDGYPDTTQSVVAPQYGSAADTPLEATVTSSGGTFDFKVEKP